MPDQKFAQDLTDPRWCVFRHVSRTSRKITGLYDQAFAPLGLTAHQFNLMMTLQRVGPSNVGTIANVVGVNPSTVPRLVKPLVKKGWVMTRPGADKRQRVSSLTPLGQAKLALALPVWTQLQQSFLAQFGDENWRQSMTDLRELRRVGDQLA